MSNQISASQKRRAGILEAVLIEISKRGLTNTTVAHIREQSGASIGSIYHHFGNREGIMAALYKACLEDCFTVMGSALKQIDHTETGIKVIVQTYLTWVENEPQKASFVYDASQGQLLRGYTDEIMMFKGQLYQEIFTWIQPRIERGELIALPPWAYDAIVMGPAHEFSRRWLGGFREMSMASAKTIIANAVWRAVRPE
ncbi:MAG: TetR/AcrR family transcriptional regulator [Anaerolineales bacterium]|nr:TetR/AcrR family transcriptional regulator [Anaerolineales bacterium]